MNLRKYESVLRRKAAHQLAIPAVLDDSALCGWQITGECGVATAAIGTCAGAGE